MSRVQTITVEDGDNDQRLDRWMRRLFPQVSQGRIEKMCRKGDLRIDGGRVKASTRILTGQQVRIPPLPEAGQITAQAKTSISDADAKMIRSCVIYRDDHVIVLNKPHGLAVQGGSKQSRHVDGLAVALMFDLDEKPRLVHRLDKDTSGVLLMARTRAVAAALTAAFRHRETRKIYWAAVAGVPHPKMGVIKYGLVKAFGHGEGGEGEKMHCVHPRDVDNTEGAKRATTDYAVLSSAAKRTAWMALIPVTGRTHQLRAHMAEIGHPIIGELRRDSQSILPANCDERVDTKLSEAFHCPGRSVLGPVDICPGRSENGTADLVDVLHIIERQQFCLSMQKSPPSLLDA
jgi:23S rRNA pseudouridine955/2504/2580 synthase